MAFTHNEDFIVYQDGTGAVQEEEDIRYRSYWFEIHTFAASASKGADRVVFEEWITNLSKRFFCTRCRKHFQKYIKNNPPEHAADPFEWTWKFHNDVNRRIGKPTISFEKAQNEWIRSNASNCTKC